MSHRISLLAALVLMWTNHPADAAVIERDWKNAGDGLLTYDDLNGHEWLDLTETLGMSFEDTSSQLEVGGKYAGFSLASVGDVIGLGTSAGIVPIGEFSAANVEPVSYLQTLVGVTNHGGFGLTSSIGMAQLDGSESLTRVFVEVSHWPPPLDGARLFTSFEVESETHQDTGIWLFRPVPEPSSFLLFGLAIPYLCLTCRQKFSRVAKRDQGRRRYDDGPLCT